MVVLLAAGRFHWCSLRPRLGAQLSAISRFSLFGTLTKSSSFNAQNIPILRDGADGAAGAVFHDTLVHWRSHGRLSSHRRRTRQQTCVEKHLTVANCLYMSGFWGLRARPSPGLPSPRPPCAYPDFRAWLRHWETQIKL